LADLQFISAATAAPLAGEFDQWGYVKGTPAIEFPELQK